ncbi:MAG: hypothetical protein ABIQ60_01820, partial [Burkholderiaceae bacterium]
MKTLLSPADRALGQAIATKLMQTRDFELSRRFIDRAHLRPRRAWKSCSIAHVCDAMQAATGHR